ncbi:MAG: prepilin-type N-terminal cleavage/methylation domain-containing protein [Candidatus Eremiobacteraeota bacterium]|nr:prepilin-type N-terminal cleavage/methylation domain-containing protein [Candidatus Eremiobacteraeota bacterium]
MFSNKKGFTLSEVMVTAVVFLLFAMSVLGMLIMGMRYLNKADADIAAQQNCRDILDVMTSELRQAAPCPDPGQGSNPARGYIAIDPPVGSTSVPLPNKNNTKSTDLLEFTEPNYSNFDPSDPDFDHTNPSNYQKIKYEVTGNKVLTREVTTYNTDGSVNTTDSAEVAVTQNGQIGFDVVWQSNKVFDVTVSTEESGKHYNGTAKVFVLVE